MKEWTGMLVLQAVVNGVVEGCIIGLTAIALTIVFRISHFANVAFGDIVTLASYLAFAVIGALSSLLLSAIIAAIGTSLICAVLYLVVFHPLRARPIPALITSIGVAIAIRGAIQLIWGGDVLSYAAETPHPLHILEITITPPEILAVCVCVLATLLFSTVLRVTRIGREIRAVASNESLALVRGISIHRVTLIVWLLAGILLAISGVLAAEIGALQPEMGWMMLLPAFAAAIFGGFGNANGAFLGALVIGVVMQLGTLVLPAGYKYAIAFGIMILLLIIRPSGLLVQRTRI